MIEIGGKLNKPTHNGFSSNISFFILVRILQTKIF